MGDGTLTRLTLTTRGASGDLRDEAELDFPAAFLAVYAVGDVLGSGAMGTVCRALQVSTRRPVAIKFLKRAGEEALAQAREALARVAHFRATHSAERTRLR